MNRRTFLRMGVAVPIAALLPWPKGILAPRKGVPLAVETKQVLDALRMRVTAQGSQHTRFELLRGETVLLAVTVGWGGVFRWRAAMGEEIRVGDKLVCEVSGTAAIEGNNVASWRIIYADAAGVYYAVTERGIQPLRDPNYVAPAWVESPPVEYDDDEWDDEWDAA